MPLGLRVSSNRCGLRAANIAALFTSTSIRPNRSTAAATIARTAAASLTSVGTPSTRPPPSSFSAAARGSATSATTTRAPSARNRRAYAKPIPAAPPVITATLSASLIPAGG
jgi:hypothetical protein